MKYHHAPSARPKYQARRTMRDYICTIDDWNEQELGGKARALAQVHRSDAAVPAWFVVTPEAFADSLTADQQAALAEGDVVGALAELEMHADVQIALGTAVQRLLAEPADRVAVRSSAVAEDGATHSFAGQLASFLGVSAAAAVARVLDVWRSAFGPTVQAYHARHELPWPPPAPAVLIQRMVEADKAGVAFSADPTTGRRDHAVVSAVFGLGSTLVADTADADTYRVRADGSLVAQALAQQVQAQVLDPEAGLQTVVLPRSEGSQAVLNEDEAAQVAALARRMERHFGAPQDVEWAFAQGQLWLLQSRPITALPAASPDGALRLWDNSNIAESYCGITTPLTFSFARRAYESVYRSFCRLMGVPERTLADHSGTFGNMLGLIRGRMYYNLLAWYEMLALLPGFRFNRTFMEGMMGVRERLPAELLPTPAPVSGRARLRDGLRFFRALGRLMHAHRTLPKRTDAFYQRLGTALALPDPETLQLNQLAQHYRGLEKQLLTRWDAPIVNDFFAMIYVGLAKQAVAAWLPQHGHLLGDLLGGAGEVISVEPARRIRAMAALAQDDAILTECLLHGTAADLHAALATRPAFAERYQQYLADFADRCLDELKLESTTLRDDSTTLRQAIGTLAQQMQAGTLRLPQADDRTRRAAAEREVRRALRWHPIRRRVLGYLLRQARARIAGRENLRFERTRVFGMARRLFLEMGRRLHTNEVLNDPQDVFYLEVEEVLGFAEGTATTTDLRLLSAMRRAEFVSYADEAAPPDRFTTRGAVHLPQPLVLTQPEEAAETGSTGSVWQGLACGPGVVRGRVRVVRDPRETTVQPGEILVAERTDPGWILLFSACSGVIVERGSLLSHAAIVARELGLPAVVALDGATRWLRDGDRVEVDGHTGRVRLLEHAARASRGAGETESRGFRMRARRRS